MSPQSLSDKLKDISLGLTTGRYDKNKVCGKLDSIAEELRSLQYVPNAMNLPKPRIRRPRPHDSDDWVTPDVGWYCTETTVGSGDTPKEAYDNWLFFYRRMFDLRATESEADYSSRHINTGSGVFVSG